MTEAVILEAIRTPMGRKKGSLSGIRPDDLAARALVALVERTGVDPAEIEDVIMGCVTQTAEQGFNIGRLAPLIAGFPVEVSGVSVNRMCGSSLQTANYAAQAIMADCADLVVAAGVESMSRVPMGSDGGSFSGGLLSKFAIVPQGLSAEMIAEKWDLSREELDEFSLASHHKALAAIAEGRFKREIVPVEIIREDGNKALLDTDETPRPDTGPEKLAALRPVFKMGGVITAGNSSQITDGAAALLVASVGKARQLGLKPRARFVSMALSGVDPVLMLHGPIPATARALKRAGLTVDDIDIFEINEAFAPVPLAWQREFGVDMSKINPNGGAIALGHPLGASGARILATLLHELERTGGRYGLATMCIGWGMGIATIIERLD